LLEAPGTSGSVSNAVISLRDYLRFARRIASQEGKGDSRVLGLDMLSFFDFLVELFVQLKEAMSSMLESQDGASLQTPDEISLAVKLIKLLDTNTLEPGSLENEQVRRAAHIISSSFARVDIEKDFYYMDDGECKVYVLSNSHISHPDSNELYTH
jgi:hypothetical protein